MLSFGQAFRFSTSFRKSHNRMCRTSPKLGNSPVNPKHPTVRRRMPMIPSSRRDTSATWTSRRRSFAGQKINSRPRRYLFLRMNSTIDCIRERMVQGDNGARRWRLDLPRPGPRMRRPQVNHSPSCPTFVVPYSGRQGRHHMATSRQLFCGLSLFLCEVFCTGRASLLPDTFPERED